MELLFFGSLLLAASVSARSSRNISIDRQPSYYNTTFVKVIMTDDIRTREAIYSTPAVVVIGKRNGEILRCLQENPNECEVFYKGNSMVNSLVVTGEYFYASLESGAILKCNLYEKSCKTHYTSDSPIVGVSAGGGYLHFGYPSQIIWRCHLNKANCQSLHKEKSGAFSFVQFEKYIYAGLNNGQLVRCSLRSENSCTVMFNMTSTVFGLTYTGKSIFAVTSDGLLWNCTRTSEDAIDSCVSKALRLQNPREIVAFDNLLYVLDKEGVRICNWMNTSCSTYAPHKDARSMAFAYSTYQMQSRFRNEDTTCTWQSDSNCPPYVAYFDEEQRASLEIHVKEGRLYNSKGFLVDTSNADEGSSGPAAIFAMGAGGRILLSNLHKTGLIHTSSLFAGNPVAGTGEMVVKNGIIENMNTCSEHYRPDLKLNSQVVQSLRIQGYTADIDSQECCQGDECGQISSNLQQQ